MKKALLSLLMLACAALVSAQSPSNAAFAQTNRGRGAQPSQSIRLTVDATEAPRKLFHAQLVFPAAPGPLTLYYPQWIPGEHGPTGPVINLAGLKMTANGKVIPWQRDAVDMYAFHVEVPAGAKELEVALDYLAPTFAGGFTSGSSTTSHLAIVTWNQLLLYPQGSGSDDLTYTASLRLPDNWKYGGSLPVARQTRERIEFAPVSLTTLIDSPVLAGEHFRAVPLSTVAPAVELDLVADSEAALNASPQFINAMRRLVPETAALFGAQHYEHYNFLLTLSDRVAHFGLEHHQSNDSRVAERALLDETQGRLALGVVSHEYVHSWNGKYRRPAGLATSDYQQPMKGELLWVYEGLTQYLGNVLAARSGIWTQEEYREHLAQIAANLDHRPGRLSRPLIDTTVGAQLFYNAPSEWSAARRGTDFYDEGWLIWLDADTLIRQQTAGRRSLDDFCKRFHGAPGGAPSVKTYTFDDVVATLNEVAPYDWRKFLNDRLYSTDFHAPLDGIARGGWRLVYDDTRTQLIKDFEEGRDAVDLGYSVGLRLKTNGNIEDVIPGTPAARAGLGPGMIITAIDGKQWSSAVMRDVVSASPRRQGPISLLVNNEGEMKTYALDYHGNGQYPHLERDASKPDLLTPIITPQTAAPVTR
ncbi:MAG: hypothetical protein WCD76_06455 [Pyrinomonadaceae bacterium]